MVGSYTTMHALLQHEIAIALTFNAVLIFVA
jgi:hypothetical protein